MCAAQGHSTVCASLPCQPPHEASAMRSLPLPCADPRIGRHEVVPGVRRSSRQKQEPLKWWLNEKKEFGRNHKCVQ